MDKGPTAGGAPSPSPGQARFCRARGQVTRMLPAPHSPGRAQTPRAQPSISPCWHSTKTTGVGGRKDDTEP